MIERSYYAEEIAKIQMGTAGHLNYYKETLYEDEEGFFVIGERVDERGIFCFEIDENDVEELLNYYNEII